MYNNNVLFFWLLNLGTSCATTELLHFNKFVDLSKKNSSY